MGISHLFDIRDKLVRHFFVTYEVAVRILSPASEMKLINVHRAGIRIITLAVLHPLVVFPMVLSYIVKFCGVRRGRLEMQSVRVGLKNRLARRLNDGIFVGRILSKVRDKQLPYSALNRFHDVGVFVPVVEVAHNGHFFCIRSPHAE